MMPFMPFKAKLRSAFCCAVAMTTAVQSVSLADPPLISRAVSPTTESETKSLAETQSQKFTARKKDDSPVRDWSRAAARSEPVFPASHRESAVAPRLRFISASGAEEGENTQAGLTDSTHEVSPESGDGSDTIPTRELSIKEQLLNALRDHRNATIIEARSARPPGSLTILNSPQAPKTKETATPSSESESEAASPLDSLPAANTRIGLTRTLEKDLKSTDPYVRDRAERYLRLEKQLLNLRANQAAKAEHSPAASMPQDDLHDASLPATTAAEHPGHAASVTETDLVNSSQGHDAASPSAADAHAVIAHDHVPSVSPEHAGAHKTAEHESPHVEPASSPHAFLLGSIVVDGPIDRLGLANNLFAAGVYPLALEMYQQNEKSGLTSQQHFWVQYQIANCLRRLGKSAEASNGYRRLAGQPEAGWLSQQAQWWVDTLEQIRIIEKTRTEHPVNSHASAVERSASEESKHAKQTHQD